MLSEAKRVLAVLRILPPSARCRISSKRCVPKSPGGRYVVVPTQTSLDTRPIPEREPDWARCQAEGVQISTILPTASLRSANGCITSSSPRRPLSCSFPSELLKQPHHRIGGWAKIATVFGGILLLLAAGTALGGILYRHRIYSQYLDELQGLRQSTEAADQNARRRFLWIEGSMILLFFSGFVILAVVDGILLLWP